MPPAFSQSQT